jgi:dihydrofolate reductase
VKAIAAMSRNRVIGASGRIPWHIPEDFRWFKKMTLGGTVLMGRKTFESLGKPLPGRTNLVLSRTAHFPGVTMLRELQELEALRPSLGEIWVIGGAELYAQLLDRCSELFLSVVEREVEGDAFFPEFEPLFEAVGVVERGPGFQVHHYKRVPGGARD